MNGKRSRGRPKSRWLDGIKEDVESHNMTMQEATRTAQDRATWRTIQKELPLRAPRALPGVLRIIAIQLQYKKTIFLHCTGSVDLHCTCANRIAVYLLTIKLYLTLREPRGTM